MLLHTFRNDLDHGAERTLSKYADDTRLGRGADRPDGCCTAIQLDLDRPFALWLQGVPQETGGWATIEAQSAGAFGNPMRKA